MLFALSLALACACTPKTNVNSWKLNWADEFDGNGIDSTAWARIPRGIAEWQDTQNDTAASLVSVSGGKLHLFGRVNDYCPDDTSKYVTGGIWTMNRKAIPAGRVEVCAKLDATRRAWPAIWMMGFDTSLSWPHMGEIDIMERLNGDAFAYQTLHSPYTLSNKKIKHGSKGRIDNGEFNVYGVDIEKDSIIMHINGVKTMTYARVPELESEEQYPYFGDQFLLLDMQLGGNWVGEVSAEDLPYQMRVDWVRSYVREEGNERQSLFFEGTKPIENREYEVFVNGNAIPVYPAHAKYDDAFDICNSRNVTIRNSFARVQDDIFAIKGMSYGSIQQMENIHCENCQVWTDKANIWRIGYECDCEVMRNITARDIVIRNVSVTGDSSVFTGPVKIVENKDGHTVTGMTIENVTYFGAKAEFSR